MDVQTWTSSVQLPYYPWLWPVTSVVQQISCSLLVQYNGRSDCNPTSFCHTKWRNDHCYWEYQTKSNMRNDTSHHSGEYLVWLLTSRDSPIEGMLSIVDTDSVIHWRAWQYQLSIHTVYSVELVSYLLHACDKKVHWCTLVLLSTDR
jgi:hypothetical protein